MEYMSSNPRGSLEWFIDQYGLRLGSKCKYQSTQGFADGTYMDHEEDYTKIIQKCAQYNKKVYRFYGGLLTCANAEGVFIIGANRGIEEILKREGYINPDYAYSRSYDLDEYVSSPYAPGCVFVNERGAFDKNFRFPNEGLQQYVNFCIKLSGTTYTKPETFLKMYEDYKAKEQGQNDVEMGA